MKKKVVLYRIDYKIFPWSNMSSTCSYSDKALAKSWFKHYKKNKCAEVKFVKEVL